MKRIALLLFALSVWCTFTRLQADHGMDGYKRLLKTAREHPRDSTGIMALIRLTDSFCLACDDSVGHCIDRPMEARKRSLKIGYSKGVILSSIQIGDMLRAIRDDASAVEYYYSALKYAEESKFQLLRRAYQGLGLIYLQQEKWADAIFFFTKAEENNNLVYKDNRYSRSLYLIGYCENKLQRYHAAHKHLEQAMDRAFAGGNEQHITEIKVSLATSLTGLGNYEEALNLYQRCLDYLKSKDNEVGVVRVYLGMAEALLKRKSYDSAIHYADAAYKISDARRDFTLIRECGKMLSRLYETTGNSSEALRYLRIHLWAKDSVSSRDLLAKLAVSQARMEFKKTEDRMNQELTEAEQKKTRLYLMLGFSGLILLLLGFAFVYVRRERKRSDNLLLNILPVETARELKLHGKALPKEHQGVSIMFCDFEGFTRKIESLSPEDLVSLLDYYFSAFDKIMARHGIEKIKTIGDAYMCVSGLNGNADHAVKMVNASLELLDFVHKTAADHSSKGRTNFNIRIGIHSGSVISGVVGTHKYAYDIWGDDVNVAARMEQVSQPGCINISQSTWELVHPYFKTESRGKLQAKNKGELAMYFVLGSLT